MPLLQRSTLPNAITTARIVMAPMVGALLFLPTFTARFIAWLLFLIAAFSDLWDGHLARKHGWISDFGKLVDPIADKLLLLTTFVPFYILSHSDSPHGRLVVLGEMPLWIMLVIFGRELLITLIRAIVARRGIVIPAGRSGKLKAVFQNLFVGTAIAWLAANSLAINNGWTAHRNWTYWTYFHGFVFVTSLTIAIALTVYSLGVYLYQWRRLLQQPL
ncbi:MAG TPA: CDP-alcohol phosphatidyltransferase family protein [Longimicrobiales bacterium]|nr:CDP-alcohol phosphatidyltransferase family protein [Longimicrobiales bacterium]